jgi:hypothetical protein
VIQFRRKNVLSFSSDSGDGECRVDDGHRLALSAIRKLLLCKPTTLTSSAIVSI